MAPCPCHVPWLNCLPLQGSGSQIHLARFNPWTLLLFAQRCHDDKVKTPIACSHGLGNLTDVAVYLLVLEVLYIDGAMAG